MHHDSYHRPEFGSTEFPLSAALRLAKRGVPIVAFDAESKRPITKHGLNDASTDEGTIRKWFGRRGLVPAIATGAASGIDVLDLDTAKHPEARAWLAANEGRLPLTFAYETRSGGRHLWLKHHSGLRCSTARPVIGVDVKSTGGTAIAWFALGHPILSRARLADWPQWLLDAVAPPPRPAYAPPAPRVPDDRQIAALIRVAATAPQSSRNSTL